MKKAVLVEPNIYALRPLLLAYSNSSEIELYQQLRAISKLKKFPLSQLPNWQSELLFVRTHAPNARIVAVCDLIFKRITMFLKGLGSNRNEPIRDSFLPFSSTSLIFSNTFIGWLNGLIDCQLSLDGIEGGENKLNSVLKITLPSSEKELCSIGYANIDLLNALKVKPANHLQFLLHEFEKLNALPLAKDLLWDDLLIWVKITGVKKEFSKFFNRFEPSSYFYHQDICKHFDAKALLETPVKLPLKLDAIIHQHLREVIGKSMVQSLRETDPVTYINPNSLRLYELERGVSIALYDMIPERQMPFQSYVGYTLLKNGYPAAYGGSWIVGERAHFGINVFEAFRGGESGYLLCQLLRIYIQLFNLKQIEVDAYQFGKNNEDGIKSGAFWFYYKYGFRPIDKKLRNLAAIEKKKLTSKAQNKTSLKSLMALAESNMVLELGESKQISNPELQGKVLDYVQSFHNGQRSQAIEHAKNLFLSKCSEVISVEPKDVYALEEFALLYAALLKENIKVNANEMLDLVRLKSIDYLSYQQKLNDFLNGISKI